MTIRGVDDELGAVLRTGPFPVALRTAIGSRGLSLQRLQHRLAQQGLHIGVTSLSYWQQGVRRPERAESLRVVRALEQILDLPADSLTSLLGPPRPRGRNAGLPPGTVTYRALMTPAETLCVLLRDLDCMDAADRVHTVTMYETFLVSADRKGQTRRTVHVVRAHLEPVDRYIMIWTSQPGTDMDLVGIRALENCRVGRVRRHNPTHLLVAELIFDHELRVGDTYLLSYELTDPGGEDCTEYERGFRFPSAQYVLQVGFDHSALPVRCHQFTRRYPDAPAHDVRHLVINAHHTVHLAEIDLQPGVLGIRWEWP